MNISTTVPLIAPTPSDLTIPLVTSTRPVESTSSVVSTPSDDAIPLSDPISLVDSNPQIVSNSIYSSLNKIKNFIIPKQKNDILASNNTNNEKYTIKDKITSYYKANTKICLGIIFAICFILVIIIIISIMYKSETTEEKSILLEKETIKELIKNKIDE